MPGPFLPAVVMPFAPAPVNKVHVKNRRADTSHYVGKDRNLFLIFSPVILFFYAILKNLYFSSAAERNGLAGEYAFPIIFISIFAGEKTENRQIMEEEIRAYKHIYMEYAPQLVRFAEKFVSDFSAEDMVHDVFLRLWNKQLLRLPDEEVRRLLYVAVRHACVDYLRHAALEREVADTRAVELHLEELDYFEASDERFMRRDLLEQLLKRVDELPERSRLVFRLSYIEGMKAAEIAERLEVSVRTVENQLYRSLLYLRKHCSDLQWVLLVGYALGWKN